MGGALQRSNTYAGNLGVGSWTCPVDCALPCVKRVAAQCTVQLYPPSPALAKTCRSYVALLTAGPN
eukprot:4114750-Pyramimonas_sp.AAC.1